MRSCHSSASTCIREKAWNIAARSEAWSTAPCGKTINMPEHDRFQVITDQPPDELVYDPTYLGIDRADDIVFIQITLNAGWPFMSDELRPNRFAPSIRG
jgi:hypothetical protein